MKHEFRIIKIKKSKFGVYYVSRKATFFRKEVLKPYITYAGLDEVYPFSNPQTAIDELKNEVIKNTELL